MATAGGRSATQQELFARAQEPKPGSALEDIRRRLPGTWAPMSIVATACNVSVSLVDDWRVQGLVEWIDAGAAGRPYYRIFVPSLMAFLATRMGGRR